MSGAFVPVTIELSQDVPALQPFLSADLARGVNNYEEDKFINGSGTGEPQGILAGADAGQTNALDGPNSLGLHRHAEQQLLQRSAMADEP